MIIHGRKQISEIVYARKASEGGGAVRLTNMIRGGSVVFGGLEPNVYGWLMPATKAAIRGAFGAVDGTAVIKATNQYLNQLAASDRDKATALAGFINEDPMMVCSLGLEPQLTVLSGMPIRGMVSDGNAGFNTGLYPNQDMEVTVEFYNGQGMQCPVVGSPYPDGRRYCYSYYFGNTAWDGYNDDVDIGTPPAAGWHTMSKIGRVLTVDGVVKRTASVKTFNAGLMFLLGRNQNAAGTDYWLSPQGEKLRKAYGTCRGQEFKYIPFKRDGVMELLDLVSENIVMRIGTFSDGYELPDGTPWTPSTP